MPDNFEWEDPPDVPALAPCGIHVWQFPLLTDEATFSLLHSNLSAEERARAARFHFDRDRNRYVVAHGVIRALLARYIALEPAVLRIVGRASNKPTLMDQPEGNALAFNLSHAGFLAVCAVGRNRNLGIDVEEINHDFDYEEIAKHCFSPQEVKGLMTLPPAQRANGFFACWTRKEAYVKALGTGLHTPIDGFTVSVLPDDPVPFLGGVEPAWTMISFAAGSCFPAALVYDGAPADLRFLRLVANCFRLA